MKALKATLKNQEQQIDAAILHSSFLFILLTPHQFTDRGGLSAMCTS